MSRALIVVLLALGASPAFGQPPAAPAVPPAAAAPAAGQPAQGAQPVDLGALVQTLLGSVGVPQEIQNKSDDIASELKQLKSRMVDLAVPDAPAFTVLGLTPDDIARPTSGRKLALSLLNGVDRSGVIQTGVAIDTLPYLALAGPVLTLDTYRGNNHYPIRFLARAQLSVATAKASNNDDDKAMRAALGLRFTVLDRGDPRTDTELDACVDKAIELPPRPMFVIPAEPDATTPPEEAAQWLPNVARGKEAMAAWENGLAAWESKMTAKVGECREQARERAWNATKWIAALAPTWISPTGAASKLAHSGYGIWTTFAYGWEGFPALEEHAQLLLHARFRSNEPIANPVGVQDGLTQDVGLWGAQLRVGTATSAVAAEWLAERIDRAMGATTSGRYSIGYERRLAPNLWLGVALGSGRADATDNTKSSSLLSSLKWGFAEGPSLGLR